MRLAIFTQQEIDIGACHQEPGIECGCAGWQSIYPTGQRLHLTLRKHLLMDFKNQVGCLVVQVGRECMLDGVLKILVGVIEFHGSLMKREKALWRLALDLLAEE